jgi:hypothetical protein
VAKPKPIPPQFTPGVRVIRSSGPDHEDQTETSIARIINGKMLVTADDAQYYADADSEASGILRGYQAFRAYPAILRLAPDHRGRARNVATTASPRGATA